MPNSKLNVAVIGNETQGLAYSIFGLSEKTSVVSLPAREILPRQFVIWEQGEAKAEEVSSGELPISVDRKFSELSL